MSSYSDRRDICNPLRLIQGTDTLEAQGRKPALRLRM